jgi:hypothetical protein
MNFGLNNRHQIQVLQLLWPHHPFLIFECLQYENFRGWDYQMQIF